MEQEITKEDAMLDWARDGLIKTPEGLSEEVKEENEDTIKLVLAEVYENIKLVLRNYSDLREDYYELVALWIIGTYLHENFETYPYLFINAMKGSGKTRLLKMIAALSNNGEVISSLKESVLFRDSKGKTLCIDEFEGIASKENQALRELLNAGYKKGNKVKRMKKKRTVTGEEYVVEEFEPYTPICMANIWGMEEVLSDRCITLILEKSSDERITRLMEDFSYSEPVTQCKKTLNKNLVQLCSYFSVVRYMQRWNLYINDRHNYIYTYTTLNTLTTHTTHPIKTHSTKEELHILEIFNRIYDTGINGRNLELMFPFFLISDFIGGSVFERMLEIAQTMTKERKMEEMAESRDILLINFLSTLTTTDYLSVSKLTSEFRNSIGEEENEDKWLNSRWVGRALKRLNMIVEKKRNSNGTMVRINLNKARSKGTKPLVE